MFGVLNLDKPPGLTSREAVNRLGRVLRHTKLGHAGTLDPLATGVLLVAVGPATRLVSRLQQQTKQYLGSFRLGWISDTEDIEGELCQIPNAPVVSKPRLEAALAPFQGLIDQRPPRYSALKVDGRRAHKLARQGRSFELKTRPVRIDSLRLVGFDVPEDRPQEAVFTVEVRCGAGTYIRSLGRDIGDAVGSGAVMTSLRRTAIGTFEAASALPFDQLDLESITRHLVSVDRALPLRRVTLSAELCEELVHGRPLPADRSEFAGLLETEEVLGMDGQQNAWAILKRDGEGNFRPVINFAPYQDRQRRDRDAKPRSNLTRPSR